MTTGARITFCWGCCAQSRGRRRASSTASASLWSASAPNSSPPGARGETGSERIPYTSEAQKAIQLAHREETTCRPNRLGTEHILLGLVRADEEALAKFGVTADRVREEVQALSASPADESPSEETPPAVA